MPENAADRVNVGKAAFARGLLGLARAIVATGSRAGSGAANLTVAHPAPAPIG
jgi:hypothetical protein